MSSLRTLLSPLIARAQWVAQLAGITFRGMRDLYTTLGYDRNVTLAQIRDRYERDGIAGRIVDAFPTATWRGEGEVVEDEDNLETMTPFEDAFDKLNKKFKLWEVFLRADILCGLNRYSVILIGAPGELDTELPRGNMGQLLYFTPFGEDEATVESVVTDPTSERFGLPSMYTLKRNSANFGGVTASNSVVTAWSKRVHWSRVLHIVERPLDDEVFGRPRLMKPWNRLDDLDKVTGGGAEAFWIRAHQGIQFNLDKDLTLSDEQEKELKAETEEFINGMKRVVRTRGMDMKSLGSDVADFSQPADAILTQIAGGLGLPKRILLGSEMGQLASSQDRSNWRDQVQDRRDSFAGPRVVRPCIERLINYGYLPQPKEFVVKWPTLRYLDEGERTDIGVKMADINSKFAGETVILPNEIREVLDLEPLEMRQEAIVQPAPDLEPAPAPPGTNAAKKPAPAPVPPVPPNLEPGSREPGAKEPAAAATE